MKIAIIDSGLDKKFVDEKKIIGGCTFKYSDDKVICVNDEYFDDNGHGTATYQIIKQNGNKKNQYYIIKILDKNNETSTEILFHALRYLLDIDVNIIHLSLAIEKYDFSGMLQLKRVCKKLMKKNKLLICAQRNKTNIPTYPAAYNSVLGVDSIYTDDFNEIWYNADKIIQCYANAVPKLVKTIENKYMFFGGTSKSAAIITGILSKETQYINIDITNDILLCLSKRRNWDIDFDRVIAEDFRKYNTEKGKERKYSQEKYITVYKSICNIMNIENKVDFFLSLPENNIYLDGNECYSLITTLEKEFDLKINIENIYYTSIYSFNSILDLFFER